MERGWQATMVLTEPDAGSDVGAGRAKAVEQPDGTWHIEGVKRFISGGDVGETAENIFHLVLARPEGAGPGTKAEPVLRAPVPVRPRDVRTRFPQRVSPPAWNTRWASSRRRPAN
ncbi:hypothetical protein MHEI_47140 [Mycobacterium heidelbergense]|nr:hypothetical protein MHEI_47140 [Mycobacterium heidelbergense]